MPERREHHRVIFRRDVYLSLPDGQATSCVSEDFSMYGMAVLTDAPLGVAQILYVDFKILSQSDWREVNLRGKVVYSSVEANQFKSGISFF